MIDLASTDISFSSGSEEIKNINECLKTLFSTSTGTVAFDRDFGLDPTILDKPIPVAKGALTVEIMKKVKKYEPRVRVSQVTFNHDAKNGILTPKVVVEIVT